MFKEKRKEESFPKHLPRSLQEEDRRILFNVFFNRKKAPYLDYLKRTVPTFLNLHPSFWENPYFLRWQLTRLNTKYQARVKKIWREKWIQAGMTERQEIEQYFFDFRDCFPRKIDTYETWGFTGWITDKGGKRYFGVTVFELMKKWDVDFPPIPWVFRFIPEGYLLQMAPVQSRPGRPMENWANNLCVYELSQLGMKDTEIAKLIYGINKSTEYYPDKHDILVKIFKIKKSLKTVITDSLPR